MLAIQKALFTAANGDFECGRFLQWDWWLWVLQLVFVSLVLAVWLTRTTRRYLVSGWVVRGGGGNAGAFLGLSSCRCPVS